MPNRGRGRRCVGKEWGVGMTPETQKDPSQGTGNFQGGQTSQNGAKIGGRRTWLQGRVTSRSGAGQPSRASLNTFLGYSLVAQRLSICLQCRRPGFNPWVRKIPWRRKWQPTPVFLPGESHGQISLVGYSPWGHKECDMTEWLHFSVSQTKEGWHPCFQRHLMIHKEIQKSQDKHGTSLAVERLRQGVWVRSLVRELRSYKPGGQKTKT